jgi:predicted transcriptional regulator
MIEIQLESELEDRLEKLAQEAHVSKSFVAREAVLRYLEDREDYLAGISALATHRYTISQEELESRPSVED